MTFSFIPAPSGEAMSDQDFVSSAMSQPMSLASTFVQSAKEGALDSFGLGTIIRESLLPPQLTNRPARGENPQAQQQRFEAFDNSMTEDQYKLSPYYRQDIPFQQGMTLERASALAEMDDARKVRDFYGAKRPVTAFFGNLAGSATDPLNYIPIAGEGVQAANVARFGKIAGRAITSAIDASANTALAGFATAPQRTELGDDTSWQSTVSQIAMAGLIGGAFGALHGRFGRDAGPDLHAEANDKLSTLQNVQTARVALNDALDGMINNGEVEMSPASASFVSNLVEDGIPTIKRPEIAALPEDQAAISDHQGAVATNEPTGEPLNPVGFTTAKGSKYIVEGQTTTRDKAARSDVGHEGDSGIKPASARTIYVDDNASVLSSAGLSGVGEKGSRVIIKDGKASLLTWNPKEDRWGVMPQGKDIPFHDEPALGRYPLELWNPADDIKGTEAYGRMHAGNEIVSIDHQSIPKTTQPEPQSVETGQTEALSTTPQVQPQPAPLSKARPATIDTSIPAAAPDVSVSEAAKRVGKPEGSKALAEQYRVNPETGEFPEMDEIKQLEAEGRLTDEDRASIEDADETLKTANAYGEALKAFSNCVI